MLYQNEYALNVVLQDFICCTHHMNVTYNLQFVAGLSCPMALPLTKTLFYRLLKWIVC